ncbi:hypothetical protein ACYJZR_01860 [Vibrio sp. RC2502]
MNKVDNKALVEHLEKAEKTVTAWPQWQQQIYRAKVSSQSTQLSKQAERNPATNPFINPNN